MPLDGLDDRVRVLELPRHDLDADLGERLLDDRLHVDPDVRVTGHVEHVLALARRRCRPGSSRTWTAASPLRLFQVAGVALALVRLVVLEVVVEHDVGDDVVRDVALGRPAPGSAEALLVHDPVGGLPHVDVVERRLRQVQGQVPRAVARLDLVLVAQILVLRVLTRDFRRHAGNLAFEGVVLDAVEDVFRIRVEGQLEAVDVVLPPLVRRLVVVGVADENQVLVWVEARQSFHRLAARGVELVRALDHVGARRDHEAAVLARVREASRDLFRNGAAADMLTR